MITVVSMDAWTARPLKSLRLKGQRMCKTDYWDKCDVCDTDIWVWGRGKEPSECDVGAYDNMSPMPEGADLICEDCVWNLTHFHDTYHKSVIKAGIKDWVKGWSNE